jgi:hypothetical protein
VTRRRERGQALVEAALLLPCLLVLLTGAYVASRSVSIVSSAESGAFAQVVRDGRRLPDLRNRIAETMTPRGEGSLLRTVREGGSRILPPPFPALDGRTTVRAEIRKGWREAGTITPWEEAHFERGAEASVDCWDAATPSGKKVRRAVRAYIGARTLF